jgi:hypothetical protein
VIERAPRLKYAQTLLGLVSHGSGASFDASGSDFRYYPEGRHLLALHQVTRKGPKTDILLFSGFGHRNSENDERD